jgi:molybdopterin converting factor small subunit
MATVKKTLVIGFTRLDGLFRHAQVTEGTKLGPLLAKFGYAENELAGMLSEVRINGAEVNGGLDYVLQKDDVIAVVPNVKGGK